MKARDPTIESLALNALSRMGDKAKPAIPIVIVTAVQRNLGLGLIRFKSPEEKDRCGLMDLGDLCAGYVRIVKTFKDDDRCALIAPREYSYVD